MNKINKEPATIGVDEVSLLTGIQRKSLILWSSDGRLPKHLKRKHLNAPYRWRTVDIERWIDPKGKGKGNTLSEERVREIIQIELIKLLRSTAPINH